MGPDMSNPMSMMVYFDIFIAVYLLYYAIKGSGKLYEGNFPEEIKDQHVKMTRIFCWVVSVPLLFLAIMEFCFPSQQIWTNIAIVYVLGCVIIYAVLFYKRFGKYLKPEKAQKPVKQARGQKGAKKK